MQGRVLDVDIAAGTGLVLGLDGNRYRFTASDWKAREAPVAGVAVDFVAQGEAARDLFPLPAQFPPHFAPPAAAGYPPGAAAGDNSVTLGWVGIACLALGLVIPLLPTIAAFILGLIGAGVAKRYNNATGLMLGRIAWIGAVALTLFALVMLVLGLSFLATIMGPLFNEMMRGNWTSV